MKERAADLVANILSQKGFASTTGYNESNGEESDRDAGVQHQQRLGTQVPNKPVIGTHVPRNLKIWLQMSSILRKEM